MPYDYGDTGTVVTGAEPELPLPLDDPPPLAGASTTGAGAGFSTTGAGAGGGVYAGAGVYAGSCVVGGPVFSMTGGTDCDVGIVVGSELDVVVSVEVVVVGVVVVNVGSVGNGLNGGNGITGGIGTTGTSGAGASPG